jgi:integrase
MENVVRAKRPRRLPVVLTRAQVARLLERLAGREALMAGLLYGSGLRLMECVRLRVKDVGLERNELVVRGGKGGKDRLTVLPASLKEALARQVAEARLLHARDLACGLGRVHLPHALARKYPNAAAELAWQYVFPATRISLDPRDGVRRRHHIDEKALQKAVRRAALESGFDRPVTPAPLLRHPSAGVGRRHPHRAGTARPQGRGYYPDLYPRAQPWRAGRAQPAGPLTAATVRVARYSLRACAQGA